jgi:glycogen synthase
MRPSSLAYNFARSVETRAVGRADAVVTICRGLYRELCGRGIREDRLFIVPNAVDERRFLPAQQVHDPTRQPVIGFLGSFYSYEGLDLLLEAAGRIVADRPELRFVLVGGGPEEPRLRAMQSAGDMSHYVTISGWLTHDRVPAAYRDIDIFVYPRRRNRLTDLVTPLKPLEAMAMAKVVLASDVGGHRELIADGRTGFLFRADDVSDLVLRLRELLEARHLWPAIGAAARRFVERERTWRAVAATYAEVYESARARRRDPDLRQPPARGWTRDPG